MYISQLRKKTGAPLMDIKKALTATGYNVKTALVELRKCGLAANRKKAGREATEGLVGVKISECNRFAAAVEINTETDFVSRSDIFQNLVKKVLAAVEMASVPKITRKSAGSVIELSPSDLETLPVNDNEHVGEALATAAMSLRENICLRKACVLFKDNITNGSKPADEVIGIYVHGSINHGLGRQAALVKLKGGNASTTSVAVANKVAMHVVAARPYFLEPSSVPLEVLDRELSLMRSQLADQGKPTKLFEKILDGRMAKFYEETCLVKQKFVLNDKKTVAEWLEGADGSLGSLHVSAFVRINPDEVVVARLPDLD
eukprot:29651-Pelagococcus_subviridis.AAC.6